jgi:PKHD-type hydroxylase
MQKQTSNYEQAQAISQHFMPIQLCNNLITKFNQGLESIIQKSNQLEYTSELEYRSVLIKDINIDEIPALKSSVLSANSQIFNFNLYEDTVDCFFAQYSTGMHYDQLHLDCIAGPIQRKLSFSLLLNDDFDGGDFELLQPPRIEKVAGKLIVFPSYLPHRVTRVTRGVRYVIFGWFYGPHYV